MRELIVAGVRAGLRAWRPWRSKGMFFALLVSYAVLQTYDRPSLWILFVIALVVLPFALAVYVQGLVGERGLDLKVTLRLVASWLLAGLFLVVVLLLFFVVLISSLYAVASAGSGFNPKDVSTWAASVDARGRVVASVVFLIGLAGVGWCVMRVWLASATTVLEDRIAMLSTWPFTRNRVLPMALTRILLSLPAALALFLLTLTLAFGGRSRPAFLAPSCGWVLILAWLPMQIGAEVEFYRRRVLPPEPTP